MKTVFKYQSDYCRDQKIDSAGFTLLEVMISISIIALILVALFRMQSGSVTLAAANKFNQLAPVLANQLMVKINRDPEEFSEKEGDFSPNFPGITWTCEISDSEFENFEYVSQEDLSGFKKIKLQITERSESKPFILTCWRLINDTER